MKKNHIYLALLFIMMPMLAGAQALKGSYFLDNSINSHKLNPAFTPRANYFQLPAIGNTGLGLYTNLDLPTFLYPLDNGKLGTFLHPQVSVEQFDRNLAKHPHLDADISTNLFSFGFFTKNKAFWNFSVEAKAALDADLPRDLLFFMKKGTGSQGGSYNVGNMNAYATAGLQASLGYSREFVKNLRTGVKLRFIAPLGYAALNLENVRLNATPEKWQIQTEGYLYTALSGLDVTIPYNEGESPVTFDPSQFLSTMGLAGFGYSLDLGASYVLDFGTPLDGLTLSASVTDLGQIFYAANAISAYESHGQMEWEGVEIEDQFTMANPMEGLQEQLGDLLNLSEMDSSTGMTRSTMPSVYLGAEMPFLKNKMSVGLLYSARFSHSYVRNELTVSYNLNPSKAFALGLNYSFLNTTGSVGAMMEFTPKVGPTLYFGCDYFPSRYAMLSMPNIFTIDIPFPMSWRLNMNFGMAFNLGSKHVNPKRVK